MGGSKGGGREGGWPPWRLLEGGGKGGQPPRLFIDKIDVEMCSKLYKLLINSFNKRRRKKETNQGALDIIWSGHAAKRRALFYSIGPTRDCLREQASGRAGSR